MPPTGCFAFRLFWGVSANLIAMESMRILMPKTREFTCTVLVTPGALLGNMYKLDLITLIIMHFVDMSFSLSIIIMTFIVTQSSNVLSQGEVTELF